MALLVFTPLETIRLEHHSFTAPRLGGGSGEGMVRFEDDLITSRIVICKPILNALTSGIYLCPTKGRA